MCQEWQTLEAVRLRQVVSLCFKKPSAFGAGISSCPVGNGTDWFPLLSKVIADQPRRHDHHPLDRITAMPSRRFLDPLVFCHQK